jgi:uncharacterized protein YcgI (DUF1989 family)
MLVRSEVIKVINLKFKMPTQTEAKKRISVSTHVIQAGHGFALLVKKGQTIRITDLEGQQVTDLLAFDAADVAHRFSRAQTKKLNARIWISTGHVLYSNLCKPMLRIGHDTVGKHDMQFSPCGPEDNLIRFGKPGARTCIGNLLEVLKPYEINRNAINEPFGIFFNMEIDTQGECKTRPPLSKAGDFVEFEACMDLLVGLSACPQVFNGCNGHKLSPVKVEVFALAPNATDVSRVEA